MRAFIALLFDESLHCNLLQVANQLKMLYPDKLKCTSPEKLHLTLHFFKDLKTEHVAPILKIIRELMQSQFPFSLQVTHKILLPNEGHPTVLAYGIRLSNQLEQIKVCLNKLLEQLGYEDEYEKFFPHITIARSKDVQLLQQIKLPELNIDSLVSECVLFESCKQAGDFAYKVISESKRY